MAIGLVETIMGRFVQNQRNCNRGQGVIEYAGALVMSAVIVSLILLIFPNPFTNFFFNSVDTIMGFFAAQVAGI